MRLENIEHFCSWYFSRSEISENNDACTNVKICMKYLSYPTFVAPISIGLVYGACLIGHCCKKELPQNALVIQHISTVAATAFPVSEAHPSEGRVRTDDVSTSHTPEQTKPPTPSSFRLQESEPSTIRENSKKSDRLKSSNPKIVIIPVDPELSINNSQNLYPILSPSPSPSALKDFDFTSMKSPSLSNHNEISQTGEVSAPITPRANLDLQTLPNINPDSPISP